MTTRSQRRQRRFTETYKNTARQLRLTQADRLSVPRDFVQEAMGSGGILSIAVRAQPEAGKLAVYGAKVVFDGETWPQLKGDGVVNTWCLPNIQGFDITYNSSGVSTQPMHEAAAFTGIDISGIWLRTAGELPDHHPSFSSQDVEEHIVVTREGLSHLLPLIGHTGLRDSLADVDRQIFETS